VFFIAITSKSNNNKNVLSDERYIASALLKDTSARLVLMQQIPNLEDTF